LFNKKQVFEYSPGEIEK